MLNKVVVQGRLVDDIVVRGLDTESTKIATFTIACERDFKNKDTGKRDVDFIDIVAKGQLAEFAQRTFAKGDTLIASGRLKRREFVDSNGNARTTLKVACDSLYFG